MKTTHNALFNFKILKLKTGNQVLGPSFHSRQWRNFTQPSARNRKVFVFKVIFFIKY